MVFHLRNVMLFFAILFGVATSYSVFGEEIYDRLDGTGDSHKKVDVIEWEGNLEIHVYPKGSAGGIAAKLDDRVEGKKVMVIGYRFNGQKEVLVRRAILGVPFTAKVKGFIDPTEKDFDKIAISNNALGAPWKPYKLDAGPKTWYPDGDERNDDDPALKKAPRLGNKDTSGTVESTSNASDSQSKPPSRRKPAAAEDDSLNQYNW